MGICHNNLTIQQIIHSKYTLAKQSTQKFNNNQYHHIYVWKYTGDDLAQKEVRFYDPINQYEDIMMINNSNSNKKVNKQNGLQQQQKYQDNIEQQQYLAGHPIQWPLKAHADEGYVILTIRNNTKHMQTLTNKNLNNNNTNNNNQSSFIQQFRTTKLPLQLSQLLYMIKLDSFKQYYYSKIQQQNHSKQQTEFSAQIEIIVGDLVQRIDCLKLVTIVYQLQKYLVRGGQNVLKSMYNQFNMIWYIISQSSIGNNNNDYAKQSTNNNNTNTNNRQLIIQSEIPIQRIFANEISRILRSQKYQQQQNNQQHQNTSIKQRQINKLFVEFYHQYVTKFNILRGVVFGGVNINCQRIANYKNKQSDDSNKISSSRNKKHNKIALHPEVAKQLIQQYKQTHQQDKGNKQKINLFTTIRQDNINNFKKSNNNKNHQSHYDNLDNNKNNIDNFDNDISIIEKNPKNNNNNNKDGDYFIKNKNTNNNNNNSLLMDTSSPFICEITQIDGLAIRGQQQQFSVDNEENNNDIEGQYQQQRLNKQPRVKTQYQQRLNSNNKKKPTIHVLQQQGNVNDESMFLPQQLQQLQVNKAIYQLKLPIPTTTTNTNNIATQQQPLLLPSPILLTTYAGSSQYHQIQKRNIKLIINLSPEQCYNYFMNDITYQTYKIQRLQGIITDQQLQTKTLQQLVNENNQQLWRFNIECITKHILYRIQTQLEALNKQLINSQLTKTTNNNNNTNNNNSNSNNNQSPSILIFCSHKHLIYSGTVCLAYLMLSNTYRLPFEQAYSILKHSTNNKYLLPKIYQQQLRVLQHRINELSSISNINTLNNTKSSSTYRGYQIGLYSQYNTNLLVSRYVHIGELASSTQLQVINNNMYKVYLLIPNNLTPIIVKAINILREDTTLLLTTVNSNNSNNNNTNNNTTNNKQLQQKLANISKLIKNMGLTIRIFYGKQSIIVGNQQSKSLFMNVIKHHILPQLIKYQYMNFVKKVFNLQKYKHKLELIIQAVKQLITIETIQKSFRKPQSIQINPFYTVNDVELLKIIPMAIESNQQQHYLQQQPYNPKQILTFKYPILRPIFQPKKKDSYYFMIKKFKQQSINKNNKNNTNNNKNILKNNKNQLMGCNVTIYKGDGWIGLQQDKQRYFEKIVSEYLKDVNEQRIWIQDQQQGGNDRSLFDQESILF